MICATSGPPESASRIFKLARTHSVVSQTTQPEYSFWFKDVGWAVENHGTEPDIEVANTPQDDAFNAPERDRQLAAAVAEALAAAERQGVSRPSLGPRPQLGLPILPAWRKA